MRKQISLGKFLRKGALGTVALALLGSAVAMADDRIAHSEDELEGRLKESKEVADEWMDEKFGDTEYADIEYEFTNAYQADGHNDKIFYSVEKTCDMLTQRFNVRVNVELALTPSGSRMDYSTPYEMPDRTWNLEGTWNYRDADRDFTLVITDEDPTDDEIEMEYSLFGYDTGPTLSFEDPMVDIISHGSVEAEIIPQNDDDDSQWRLSFPQEDDEEPFTVWLYPLGATLDKSGEGSGPAIQGYFLAREEEEDEDEFE